MVTSHHGYCGRRFTKSGRLVGDFRVVLQFEFENNRCFRKTILIDTGYFR